MSNAPFLVNFLSPRKNEQCCYNLKQDFLNQLLLKQHRCSCFCNALLILIYCWWCNFSWHWIIHPAAHEYWFPMTLKVCYHILLIVTINASLYSEWAGKIWMIYIYYSCEIFLTEFSSKNIVEQYILKSCFLLNSITCNHWNLRMKSLSILPHSLPSCLPYHASKREDRWGVLKRARMVPFGQEISISHPVCLKTNRGKPYITSFSSNSAQNLLMAMNAFAGDRLRLSWRNSWHETAICEGIPVVEDSLQTSDVD